MGEGDGGRATHGAVGFEGGSEVIGGVESAEVEIEGGGGEGGVVERGCGGGGGGGPVGHAGLAEEVGAGGFDGGEEEEVAYLVGCVRCGGRERWVGVRGRGRPLR